MFPRSAALEIRIGDFALVEIFLEGKARLESAQATTHPPNQGF